MVPRRRVAAPSARVIRRMPRRRAGRVAFAADEDNGPDKAGPCDGCVDSFEDEDGSWELFDCTEDQCLYRQPSPYVIFE
jgi:hypothetical protein